MYMPVLKSKPAEIKALESTDQAAMSPLIDLLGLPPKAPSTAKNPRTPPTLRQRISSQVDELAKVWHGGPLRIDFADFVQVHQADDFAGETAASVFGDDAQGRSLEIIPVTGIERSAGYQVMVRELQRQFNRGIAIRIPAAQFSQSDLVREVTGVMTLQDLRRPDVDLIFDAGGVSTADLSDVQQRVVWAIKQLEESAAGRLGAAWRSVTLASAGWVLQNPQNTVPGQEVQVPRKDWHLFLNVRGEVADGLWYGDYGIESTKPPGPKSLNYFSNLRYTLADTWLFIRGKSNQEEGGVAYFKEVCAQLVSSGNFAGSTFSEGDAYLDSRNMPGESSGGAVQWREAMFSHHFAVVIEQLRTLPGRGSGQDSSDDDEWSF